MPTLIIENSGRIQGGVLAGSLLIGRHPINGLVIREPAVSRVHAWIGSSDGAYFVADAGSRGGTWLNGKKIERRTRLNEGDVLQVGSAQIAFSSSDLLAGDIMPIDLLWKGPAVDAPDRQVGVRCECGHRMTFSTALLGQPFLCGACQTVSRARDAGTVMEAPQSVSPATTPSSAIPESEICAVCQSMIAADDAITRCSGCDMVYHSECWTTNRGCAAYGCDQVNALDPAPTSAASTFESTQTGEQQQHEPARTDGQEATTAGRLPWDYLLLGASALAIPAGVLAFGAASALTAAGAVCLMRDDTGGYRRSVLAISFILSIIGVAAGVSVSRIWWNAG
jgi:hypothetical protein